MRIRELNLIAYGKLTNHKLMFPAAKHDFHVVVGANEAGKSPVRRTIKEPAAASAQGRWTWPRAAASRTSDTRHTSSCARTSSAATTTATVRV